MMGNMESTCGVKVRVSWVDYAKAIAITFVIIWHVSTRNYLSDWIYSFHMPLFFFLSGITLKANRRGYKAFIKKLVKRLLPPYILYSLLYFALNVAKVAVLHNNINLIHNLTGIIVQMSINYASKSPLARNNKSINTVK